MNFLFNAFSYSVQILLLRGKASGDFVFWSLFGKKIIKSVVFSSKLLNHEIVYCQNNASKKYQRRHFLQLKIAYLHLQIILYNIKFLVCV